MDVPLTLRDRPDRIRERSRNRWSDREATAGLTICLVPIGLDTQPCFLLYQKGNWVLIVGEPGSSADLIRVETFINTLKNSPGLKILSERWAQPTVNFTPVPLLTAENLDTIDRSELIIPAKESLFRRG